jgi:hypothetical protein
MTVFSVEERARVSGHVLEMARRDDRVVAAAVVGSLVGGGGDRWSDIDLTFAVDDGTQVNDVIDDWTNELVQEFEAIQLFDLSAGPMTYRVFLLPNLLQLDVSFTPSSQFVATSPRFDLLFGSAGMDHRPPPSDQELLGWAVLFARYTRVCIERERWWQAEFAIAQLRYYGLSLAARRRDLPATDGRGFDRLPADLLETFAPSLVTSVDRQELLRAWEAGVDALARQLRKDEEAIKSRLQGFLR